MAIKVVAANLELYPALSGVNDQFIESEVRPIVKVLTTILIQIIKLADINLPVTVTGRNVEFEFYWEEKCKKQLKNCRKEDHGGSYKQAYIERHM